MESKGTTTTLNRSLSLHVKRSVEHEASRILQLIRQLANSAGNRPKLLPRRLHWHCNHSLHDCYSCSWSVHRAVFA